MAWLAHQIWKNSNDVIRAKNKITNLPLVCTQQTNGQDLTPANASLIDGSFYIDIHILNGDKVKMLLKPFNHQNGLINKYRDVYILYIKDDASAKIDMRKLITFFRTSWYIYCKYFHLSHDLFWTLFHFWKYKCTYSSTETIATLYKFTSFGIRLSGDIQKYI